MNWIYLEDCMVIEMNSYMKAYFTIHEETTSIFSCLFRVEKCGYPAGYRGVSYKILNILSGNKYLIFKKEEGAKHYQWSWATRRIEDVIGGGIINKLNKKFYDTIEDDGDSEILEFEDDNCALLWYRLNI